MIYKKGITESEWEELLALEYVLTHYPQSTTKKDEVRYMELSDKNGVMDSLLIQINTIKEK